MQLRWMQPLRQAIAETGAAIAPSVRDEMMAAVAADEWRVDHPHEYCNHCGATVAPGAATLAGCAFCHDQVRAWSRCVRLSAYKEPFDSWVRNMKFAGRWNWGDWFGQLLAEQIIARSAADCGDRAMKTGRTESPVAVCPVPMHWRRRVMRGYNQSMVMAASLAKRRHWPMIELLRRRRYTPPQSGLAPTNRRANVRGAFGNRKINLTGWTIWLVDDVKTTGATLHTCARLLRKAGASDVHIAVAAVADPKGKDFKVL